MPKKKLNCNLVTLKYAVKLFLIIFLLEVGIVARAQQPMFTNQERFGVDEGLPQSYIRGISQDKDGFIWIATMDGLSRYDGRGFKNFRSRPGDTTGLTRNAIINMILQGNNKLSLFYEGFFAEEFNVQTFKTIRNLYQSKLRNIPGAVGRVMNINNVYNGTDWFFIMHQYKGIGWLNCKNGKITYASKANGMLKRDTINAFLQTTDGRLYLVSEDGVQVSDIGKKKFEFIQFPTTVKKLTKRDFRDGILYAGSLALLPNNKLLVYQHNRIVILDLTQKSAKTISIPEPQPGSFRESDAVVYTDHNGQPYFVNAGRIFTINQQGVLKLLWQNNIAPQLNITAYFIDRSDVLWVSVNAQGIVKVDLQVMPFQSYRYKNGFIADIMTQAGAAPSLLPPHWSVSVVSYYFRQAYDSKNRLYVCNNYFDKNEVYEFDKKDLRVFSHLPKKTSYTALVVMPDDEVRVFDQEKATWYCWKTPSSVPDIIPLNKAEMSNVELADARFIGGSMWLTTYSQGLLQYQGAKRIHQFMGKQANGYLPKELTEICINPVNKNQFWIGSRGGGLILWDVSKGLQRIYTTNDGLPNNTVYCILPDKSGKIWCSTNKGIFRFDPITKEINVFEKSDGLQGNEFNRAHKFLFADGRMAFGGIEGYTIFDPAKFEKKRPAVSVPVQLTALQINNEPQDGLLYNNLIKDPLSLLSKIDLPYNKNYLRFEFAAMLYNQPQKTKYRYQLEGIDEDWIENGTNNIVSYTALRPGKYKLLINATDNNGTWSQNIKEIAIVIHPPFWATWWAYTIYALIALVLVRWYFVYKERMIRTQQSLSFEKREALRLKEVDEVKDRFFSNITHEFRTPLTLIITPLEKLIRDNRLPASVVQSLKNIQKNSHQLLKLINEFLDFSKVNSGQMKVRLSSGELSLFVSDCVKRFNAGALDKNIRLSFFSEGVEGFYLFDEEKWGKIITNLLSNALKFTPQNGAVSLSLAAAGDEKIKLEVKDNGPGIPADQQIKIFERFYQADSSAIRNYSGTGIGLSLVKELILLMNGTIELDSIPGKYSRFIVELPVQKGQATEATVSLLPGEMTSLPDENQNEQDGPLIMIAEDNEELRSFLQESMRDKYSVIAAADGLQAWEMILQELPDIVISDVMMPGRDGFDLCRLCKSDKRTAHIGFILLTSKAAHEAQIKGLETGADDYITKPFHLDELELRIVNLLRLQEKVRLRLQEQMFTTTPQKTFPAVSDVFLVQLYKEMDAKIDDPELDVDYLSRTMAMSRSTLNRKLKSLLDISPNGLIRQYRLQKATGYLSSGLDITSAAYKVGFSSPSYFSQCFREQYGISPSDYVLRQN